LSAAVLLGVLAGVDASFCALPAAALGVLRLLPLAASDCRAVLALLDSLPRGVLLLLLLPLAAAAEP
jgi:hypothetical protein